MKKTLKLNIQDIHYLRQKPPFVLSLALSLAEFFYKKIINYKNSLYERNVLKEEKVRADVICVGNLTTGGVGKTPIVIKLANELSKNDIVAVISRGYKAELSSKNPVVVKDLKEIRFENGTMCGDEPFQIAKKTGKNVIVIICADRKKAAEFATIKYGAKILILDDGFSNRKLKKDKTIVVIDSKMRFGNNRLLPLGPLREPVSEIKRADEIILVDKGDENLSDAINWVKQFKKPLKLCKMEPKIVYNLKTKANVVFYKEKQKAIAFCAIGQSEQFFEFAQKYYETAEKISYQDHHKYSNEDIKKLVQKAKDNQTNILITTQKDETKILDFVDRYNDYNFNVLELSETIIDL